MSKNTLFTLTHQYSKHIRTNEGQNKEIWSLSGSKMVQILPELRKNTQQMSSNSCAKLSPQYVRGSVSARCY